MHDGALTAALVAHEDEGATSTALQRSLQLAEDKGLNRVALTHALEEVSLCVQAGCLGRWR